MEDPQVDLVSGDGGFISDDSSFYGDDDYKSQLESIEGSSGFWSYHSRLPSTIVFQATNQAPPKLFNPYKDEQSSRQLDENVDEFVDRLRPSTSTLDNVGPWIWIANPYHNTALRKQDTPAFTREGSELLEEYLELQSNIQKDMHGKSASVVGKKLTPKRKILEQDIRELAIKHGVTDGKWLLFPDIKELDKTWRIIAEAVSLAKLGTAAKVATAGAERDQNVRLICIYTKNFDDVENVRSVLLQLRVLGLVSSSKPIYYKTDAYTHLGIESKNPYGLKASMYSSSDMIGKGK